MAFQCNSYRYNTDPATFELIEAVPGERRRVDSLDDTVRQLMRLLEALSPLSPEDSGGVSTAEGKMKWRWLPSRVHLFGFSDGGAVALEAAARCVGERRLGGAAVVCASLLQEVLAGPAHEAAAVALARLPPDPRAPTPVVLTCGAADKLVPRRRAEATAAALRARNPGCVADVHVIEGRVGTPHPGVVRLVTWNIPAVIN